MNLENKEICRLCNEEAQSFLGNEFFQCKNCKGISRKLSSLPDSTSEKNRYDQHENSLDDGYLNFISPVINFLRNHQMNELNGLDFGSGPNSFASKLLKEENFNIQNYDPYYENNSSLLKEKFDYIIAIEVIEHFHFPKEEFHLLKSMLQPKGELLMMTHLYEDSINFEKWYYKNDFTHAFFYKLETLNWIKNHFGFSELEVKGRFIRLKN